MMGTEPSGKVREDKGWKGKTEKSSCEENPSPQQKGHHTHRSQQSEGGSLQRFLQLVMKLSPVYLKSWNIFTSRTLEQCVVCRVQT